MTVGLHSEYTELMAMGIEKLKVPAIVGVSLIEPSSSFTVNPGGRLALLYLAKTSFAGLIGSASV